LIRIWEKSQFLSHAMEGEMLSLSTNALSNLHFLVIVVGVVGGLMYDRLKARSKTGDD